MGVQEPAIFDLTDGPFVLIGMHQTDRGVEFFVSNKRDKMYRLLNVHMEHVKMESPSFPAPSDNNSAFYKAAMDECQKDLKEPLPSEAKTAPEWKFWPLKPVTPEHTDMLNKAFEGTGIIWNPWSQLAMAEKSSLPPNRYINEWGFEWGGERDSAIQQSKTEDTASWKPAFISGIVHSGLGHLLGEAWRKDHQSARPVPTRATTNKTEEVSAEKMKESIIEKVISSLNIRPVQDNKTEATPFSQIKAQLQADSGFAWGWHCNLAGAYAAAAVGVVPDASQTDFIANRAAESSMSTTFDVDMRENEIYRDWMRDFSKSNPEFMAAFWAKELARLKAYHGEIYIEKCRKFYFGE